MAKSRKHIELFAGCGGMTLGLEAAGFKLVFANEKSPMAGNTFAYNILNEDLERIGITNESFKKTLWINSQYKRSEILRRLRENPTEAKNGEYSDLSKRSSLKGKLLIGSIRALKDFLKKEPTILRKVQGIDVLSGGPPCQGFSLAGRRIKDDKKNLLPWEFAEVAGLIKPKVILLENVQGITTAFTQDNKKYYAWIEVAKAFALKGFIPVCFVVNSKYFGVPQNRLRFILLGFREDIFEKIRIHIKGFPVSLFLEDSMSFYKKVQKFASEPDEVSISDLNYYEIDKYEDSFNGFLFPRIETAGSKIRTTLDAIDNIKDATKKYTLSESENSYMRHLNNVFKKDFEPSLNLMNHDARIHEFNVEARFRLYQIINEFSNGYRLEAIKLITGKSKVHDGSKEVFNEFSKHKLFYRSGDGDPNYEYPLDRHEIEKYIESLPTKKHSQKALQTHEPAPAQMTIPDDICHYDSLYLRTLTVREMARFQSFPDWFVFRSKVTTGGELRKFEIPQYTQVGNAVPPLLAKALGDTIKRLLETIEES